MDFNLFYWTLFHAFIQSLSPSVSQLLTIYLALIDVEALKSIQVEVEGDSNIWVCELNLVMCNYLKESYKR